MCPADWQQTVHVDRPKLLRNSCMPLTSIGYICYHLICPSCSLLSSTTLELKHVSFHLPCSGFAHLPPSSPKPPLASSAGQGGGGLLGSLGGVPASPGQESHMFNLLQRANSSGMGVNLQAVVDYCEHQKPAGQLEVQIARQHCSRAASCKLRIQ